MFLDRLRAFLREKLPSHLVDLWNFDLEAQILWSDDTPPTRIGEHFNDNSYLPAPEKMNLFGVSGWNHVDRLSTFGTIDLDSAANHAGGLSTEELDDIVRRLSVLEEVEIIRSKSGKGYHVRVFFDPDDLPRAETRNEHGATINRAVGWLSQKTGIDLAEKKDVSGYLAWIWAAKTGERGFELVKKSHKFLPREAWQTDQPAMAVPKPLTANIALTDDQQRLVKLLAKKGAGEFRYGRLNTHTFSLRLAHKALKLAGQFSTISTGKDGPSDRNCFAHPQPDGSWRVCRHQKGTKESQGWFVSRNGWTTAIYGRAPRKVDAPSEIVELAKAGEMFFDSAGNTYATIEHRGAKETTLIGDEIHRAHLRLEYTDATGLIASREAVKTAVEQLRAIAKTRNEYQVAIRIAAHGDRLFIDLGNTERQIVEVTPSGWSIAQTAPVKFRRVAGMLPLPTPLPGGCVDDLWQYVNVTQDDRPLMLAFIIGCFHPAGPYPLLQLVGEKGSAKTSTARLIHDFVDPNVAICGNLPKDSRNLLVAAQQTWLLSFDNLDGITKEQSALLCKLATGQSERNRKLWTDDDQAILKAKRPTVLTGIRESVVKSDLLDRTISLRLPVIEPGKRRSEYAMDTELRKEGVRGKLFGAILNGVSAALAGHAKVTLSDTPRMLDFFTWATAAERGLGLAEHSIIDAYRKQAAAQAESQVDESAFAAKIKELCKLEKTWTAKELAAKVGYASPREAAGELRELAPDLRDIGYVVRETEAKGRTCFKLGNAKTQNVPDYVI